MSVGPETSPGSSPDARVTLELDHPFDVSFAFGGYHLASDPTRWARRGLGVAWASRLPDGPVTVRVRRIGTELELSCWGEGAGHLLDRLPRVLGHDDDPRGLRFGHPVLDEVNRRHPGARHGATLAVVDGLLGRTLGQRVLAREAGRSWARLCDRLGDPAPGPFGLRLPPDPDRVAEQPTWWFHQQGVERQRAQILQSVARHARRLAEAADLPLPDAYRRLRAIPGIGPWTANGIARVALGDPDALTVGDFWVKHTVVSFFTDAERGTDEEMIDLVAPWAGQRGRVERLIGMSGHRIQKKGPGLGTPDIRRM